MSACTRGGHLDHHHDCHGPFVHAAGAVSRSRVRSFLDGPRSAIIHCPNRASSSAYPARTMPQLDQAVYARIAYFLSFRDMTRLRQCSKRTLAGVGMEHRASLCRIVGRFVPDPQSLCEALEERHAFVGGSCALLFFLRDVDFQPSNLDVYVPREEGERPPKA